MGVTFAPMLVGAGEAGLDINGPLLLVVLALAVALAVRAVRVPYTIALVFTGLVIGLSSRAEQLLHIPADALVPDLIFLVLLPPLLFEGCVNIDLETFRRRGLFVVALAVITSKRWRQSTGTVPSSEGARLRRTAIGLACLAYIQLVLGAFVRHVPETARPGEFQAMIIFHLLGAVVLAVHAIYLGWIVLRRKYPGHGLRFTAWSLVTVVGIQIGLGLATWVAKYGFPGWFQQFPFPAQHLIVANGPWQYGLATAHMATGSLFLAAAVTMALRSARFLRPISPEVAAVAAGVSPGASPADSAPSTLHHVRMLVEAGS